MELYKIANNYYKVLNDMGDIFDIECIQNTLDGIEEEFSSKALNVAAYVKRQEKQINAMAEYEKEVSKRRKTLQNKNENLKKYIQENMEKCNKNKIDGIEFSISIRKCPPSVIIDEQLISDDYISKIVKHFDKNKIKESLVSGIDVIGAKLEVKNSLTIK